MFLVVAPKDGLAPSSSPKEITLGLLGPCFITSLAKHNFYSYIFFLHFQLMLMEGKGRMGVYWECFERHLGCEIEAKVKV
jgi:hypothetical protein